MAPPLGSCSRVPKTMKAPGTILLVEDEEHLARGLKFNLEAEGYKTEVAGDGETALNLLLEQHAEFDLLVYNCQASKDNARSSSRL